MHNLSIKSSLVLFSSCGYFKELCATLERSNSAGFASLFDDHGDNFIEVADIVSAYLRRKVLSPEVVDAVDQLDLVPWLALALQIPLQS